MTEEAMDIVIREVIPTDAAEVMKLLQQTSQETGFMVGGDMLDQSIQEEAEHIERIYQSPNHFLMIALREEQAIGIVSVNGRQDLKTRHIGEVGVAVAQDYWNMGLGTVLLEEVLDWAEKSSIIKRLELTVQDRNERAKHVYQKIGFKTEAIMNRGVWDDGEYLDVCLMSKMVGEV